MEKLGRTDPRRVGPYRIAARVGSGGMGRVYAAPGKGGGLVAVKVIHDEFAVDSEFRARFAREVDLIGRAESAYLPAFHGADPAAATPWLATDYVPGPTLEGWVRQHGPLPQPLLGAFAAGVAQALVAVHAAGVVHRDLKPGNVVLSGSGPMVLDFGIARAVEETALTRTGLLVGTPGWISPEQYEGRPATFASDTFSWAALVVLAATGRSPYGTGSPEVLAHRAATRAADLTGVPPDWRPLLSAALDPDPARRPTGRQVAQALAEHVPSPATWPISPEQPRLPRRPVPRGVPAAGAAACAAVLLAGGAWTLLGGGAQPPPGAGPAAQGTGGQTGSAEPIDWTSAAPELAVNQADNAQGAARAQIGQLSTPELAELEGLEGVGDPDEGAVVRLADPDARTLTLLFHEVARTDGRVVVQLAVVEAPDTGNLLEAGMFGAVGPGSQEPLAPAEESSFDQAAASFTRGEPTKVRLVFDGAPGRGLLTVGGTESPGPLQGVPEVAVCYNAGASSAGGASGGFSIDYADCE